MNASGTSSQTSGGAEVTLATITSAGGYQLVVDPNATGAVMAGGATPDTVELRVYVKPYSAAAETLADVHTIIGAQSTAFMSKPYLSPISIKFTIKQTAGTARALPWGIWAYP